MYRDTAQPRVCRLAAELFTDKHDYLLAIARRNAHTEADAVEALQEAFASFIAKFDPASGAPPLAWLTLTL
jgi:DNA-directed RNA polymerase specialized sigma24 family protein